MRVDFEASSTSDAAGLAEQVVKLTNSNDYRYGRLPEGELPHLRFAIAEAGLTFPDICDEIWTVFHDMEERVAEILDAELRQPIENKQDE